MSALYAPNGSPIIGTVETIPLCLAHIGSASARPGGGFDIVYGGGTDVNWDAQTTTTNGAGERMFFDEDHTMWPESALTLRDD